MARDETGLTDTKTKSIFVKECGYMEKIEKCLKKIRRWEEELAYANPTRAASLTTKIARLKTRL